MTDYSHLDYLDNAATAPAQPVYLILGVHNHQPVDNTDQVLEASFQKCYKPFLETLERHPHLKMSLHYSGYLLDWLVQRHPEFLDLLKGLIARNQVELFTGGYYEPLLAMVPEKDAVGQIQAHQRRIKELTGEVTRGLWLTERVWEPHLPKILSQAGVEYLFVDDAHFIGAGLDEEELYGRYTTEDQGKTLDIFPVSKQLRYLIPYAKPQDVIDFLLSCASPDKPRALMHFDDGEKFGGWPGTYEALFEKGWLDEFFGLLADYQGLIHTVTPSQYVQEIPSQGRIYLPTSSYSEMMEWALPSQQISIFRQAQEDVPEHYSRFLRGGFWRHFLVKYPEANNLHKKMLYISRKLDRLEAQQGYPYPEARQALWKGQCNDVYWHGMFGGIYLTNLRRANYKHLIEADTLVDAGLYGPDYFQMDFTDLDCDGQPEVIIETPTQALYFDPDEGGTLFELDYRPKEINLLDTLARRHEPYHDNVDSAQSDRDILNLWEDGTPKNFHARWVCKESGLDQFIAYDKERRVSLMDHFWPHAITLDQVVHGEAEEVGEFAGQPYAFDPQERGVEFSRTARIRDERTGELRLVTLTKTITLDPSSAHATIHYRVENLSDHPLQCELFVEFNINGLAPDCPHRYYQIPASTSSGGGSPSSNTTAVCAAAQTIADPKLQSTGVLEAIPGISVVDHVEGFRYTLQFSSPVDVWRFPIFTISQSEYGFEKIYQSSVLLPHWSLDIPARGHWETTLTQTIQ